MHFACLGLSAAHLGAAQLMLQADKDAIAGYSLSGGRSAPAAKKAPAGRPAPASRPAAPAAANGELQGVKVTQIRKGDGVTYPQPGDELTMHYVGKLRSNKKVRGLRNLAL